MSGTIFPVSLLLKSRMASNVLSRRHFYFTSLAAPKKMLLKKPLQLKHNSILPSKTGNEPI